MWFIRHLASWRPQWWTLHRRVYTDWYRTNILNSIFQSLRLCRTCLLLAVIWMENPGEQCEPQLSSFNYHNFPPPIAKAWFEVGPCFITASIHDTGLTISKVWCWSDFLVCVQPNRIFVKSLQLIYSRTMVIEFRTKYLPPTHFTQMADQYGVTLEDYVYDLKILSNDHYIQGMPAPGLLFSKQRLKFFQAIVATLMLYDVVYHIPEQVNLSICKKWLQIYLLFQVQHLHRHVSHPMANYCHWHEISGGSGQNCMLSIFLSW